MLSDKGINKPIWLTESELDLGDDVLSAVEGAFNAGASKLFFSALIVDNKDGKKDKPEMKQF